MSVSVVVTVDLSCRLGVHRPRLASRTMHEYPICWYNRMHFTLPPKAYLFLSVFLLLMGGYTLPITLFQLVLIFGCLMLAWCAIGLKSRGQTFVSALFALGAVLYNPFAWELLPVAVWLVVVGVTALMMLVLAFKR